MTSTSDCRLHDLFDRRLAAGPDQIFLLAPEGHYSFTQLARMIDLLETELRGAGVLPGDRVMAVAENCPEHVALIIACSRIGAWSCGVNARMSEGEIGAFREKADPRIVYFTSRVSDAAAAHASAAGASASILPGLTRSAPRTEARAEEGSMARGIAAIIFTSGTTGTPKGVLVSQAGLTHFGRVSAESRQLTPADRSYAYLPRHRAGRLPACGLRAGDAKPVRPGGCLCGTGA